MSGYERAGEGMYFSTAHADPTGGRLFPMPNVTADFLSMIPLGSEVIIIRPGAVECGDWTEESRDKLVSVAGDMTDEDRDRHFIVYLPPLVSKQNAVLEAVSAVDMGTDVARTVANMHEAIQSGWLTTEDLVRILLDVASEAQKEVTPS